MSAREGAWAVMGQLGGKEKSERRNPGGMIVMNGGGMSVCVSVCNDLRLTTQQSLQEPSLQYASR